MLGASRGRWNWSRWFYAARALILTTLWANTPWPHQIRAPVRVVNSVRSIRSRVWGGLYAITLVHHLILARKLFDVRTPRRVALGSLARGTATAHPSSCNSASTAAYP